MSAYTAAVVELLKLGLVGLIASLFTHLISSHQHRQLRWWELKVQAYRDAIESLSDLVFYYDLQYQRAVRGGGMTEELTAKLEDIWDKAGSRIRQLTDSGAFLFSASAENALRKLMQTSEADFEHYGEHAEAMNDEAKNCLKTLVEVSRTDLRLRGAFDWLKN